MDGEILTIKEVAEYLKLAEKTAYRLVAEGKIPGFKVGGAWRFQKEEIERWIKTEQGKAKSDES
jgi:excisionase family DNA binding protein